MNAKTNILVLPTFTRDKTFLLTYEPTIPIDLYYDYTAKQTFVSVQLTITYFFSNKKNVFLGILFRKVYSIYNVRFVPYNHRDNGFFVTLGVRLTTSPVNESM